MLFPALKPSIVLLNVCSLGQAVLNAFISCRRLNSITQGKEACIIPGSYVSRNESTVLSLQLAEMGWLLTGTCSASLPGILLEDWLRLEHTDCCGSALSA